MTEITLEVSPPPVVELDVAAAPEVAISVGVTPAIDLSVSTIQSLELNVSPPSDIELSVTPGPDIELNVDATKTITLEVGYDGPPGPPGPPGDTGPPGPTAVSADSGNVAILGTDDLIYVPPGSGGGGTGADEVWIGTTTPVIPTVELWVKQDDNSSVAVDKTYTHLQATMSNVWTVNHNLGKRPAVAAQDGAGTTMYGSIRYVNNNQLTITFQNAITGRADCN